MPKHIDTLDHDEDGFWVYYAKGRKSASDPLGAQHSDVADTRKERDRMIADAIPCDCADCCDGGTRARD